MINLSDISDNKYGYSPQEIEEVSEKFKALPVNEELTMEQLRSVVLYNRMQREEAFFVGVIKKKTKTQIKKEVIELIGKDPSSWTEPQKEMLTEFLKEYKPKKLSRKAAEELLDKKETDKLSLIEEKDLERTLAEYKPRKLSNKALTAIVAKGDNLNAFEKLDLEHYLKGE